MYHLLVPTDFSKTAKLALDFAVNIAKQTSAKITLLHSFEIDENMYVTYMGMTQEFNNAMIDSAHEELNKIRGEYPNDLEINTKVATLELSNSITLFAEENEIDFIIMGTIGDSNISSKLFGSRTNAVIGKTEVPVIAIPHDYTLKTIQSIAFSTKFFETQNEKIKILAQVLTMFKAQLSIVSHITPQDEDAEEIKEGIDYYVNILEEDFQLTNINTSILQGNDYNEDIQKYLSENSIDMLAMVTYQRGFWSRLFHPSQTKRMSLHSKIPLLVIPVKE